MRGVAALLCVFGAVLRCSEAKGLGGQVFAATLSSSGTRSFTTMAANTCAVGSVGLIDPTTGRWNTSSCLEVDWADDAETASVLSDGTVLVYVTPDDGSDTFLARVDFGNRSVTTAIVGGDQGNLRCTPAGKCYGVQPGSGKTDPTVLVEVDGRTGDSASVLTLKRYDGYTVDASVIDADSGRYHAILVGPAHNSTGGVKSDQWLVTIDLNTIQVLAAQPVGANLMGPFVFSRKLGLLTFGSDSFDGALVAIDYRTAKQTPVLHSNFGTVYLFTAAFSAETVFAYSIFPHPTRFFAADVAVSPAKVTANHTFKSSVHALAAAWNE